MVILELRKAFWLKDESLENSANLPDPDVIAAEIAEDLQAALDQFTQIAADLTHPHAKCTTQFSVVVQFWP